MKLTLHQVNLSTDNVSRMNHFYHNILGLSEATRDLPVRDKAEGYRGNVSFLSDGNIQYHLAEKDLKVGFRTGHAVNQLEKGHIAFRTDDIEAAKSELEAAGVPYSDFGNATVDGWYQIFFFDPDGNVVEIHQKQDG